DTLVGRVSASGLATAESAGTVKIIARVGTAADTATLVVAQTIAFLFVAPGLDTMVAIADTSRIAAIAKDSAAHPIPNPTVTWATSDPNVATVDARGLVRAVTNGLALVTASRGVQAAMAFPSERGIAVMGEDGSERIVLIDDPTVAEPALSPDGTRLAFTRTPDWRTCEIYAARADGSDAVKITSPQPGFGEPIPWC